jgi:hypothetical protein
MEFGVGCRGFIGKSLPVRPVAGGFLVEKRYSAAYEALDPEE